MGKVQTIKSLLQRWEILDQVTVSGGNFLLIAICAHKLSAEHQGVLVYIVAVYFFLLFLNIALYPSGAAVLGSKKEEHEKVAYLSLLAQCQGYTAAFFSVLLGILILLLNTYYDWRLEYHDVFIILLFLFFQQLADFYRRSSYIFFTAREAARSSLLVYVPRILLLSIIDGDNQSHVYMILALTAVPPVVYLHKSCGLKVRISVILSELDEHFRFSRLLVGSAIISWGWSFIPLFVLGYYRGNESVAVLGSMRSLTNISNVFLEQLEISVAAKLPKLYSNGEVSGISLLISKIVLFGGVFWILGLLIIWFFGELLLGYVLGDYYVDYKSVLFILWISILLYFFSRIVSIYARSLFNQKAEFVGSITSIVTAVVISPLLIIEYGVDGAALSFVCMFFMSVIMQVIYIKYKGIALKQAD